MKVEDDKTGDDSAVKRSHEIRAEVDSDDESPGAALLRAKKARLANAARSREARMAEEVGRKAIMTSDEDSTPPPPAAKKKTPTSKKRSASSGTPKRGTSKKVLMFICPLTRKLRGDTSAW